MTYLKLSQLNTFTIVEVDNYVWKKWNTGTNKMETSPTYADGFQKKYPCIVRCPEGEGTLELSTEQYKQTLEACAFKGKADVINKTFTVKNNGKSGIDLRYYINLQRKDTPESTEANGMGSNFNENKKDDTFISSKSDTPVNADFNDLPF